MPKEVTICTKKIPNRIILEFLFILFLSFVDCHLSSVCIWSCVILSYLPGCKISLLHNKLLSIWHLLINLKIQSKRSTLQTRWYLSFLVCEFSSSHIYAGKNNLRHNPNPIFFINFLIPLFGRRLSRKIHLLSIMLSCYLPLVMFSGTSLTENIQIIELFNLKRKHDCFKKEMKSYLYAIIIFWACES